MTLPKYDSFHMEQMSTTLANRSIDTALPTSEILQTTMFSNAETGFTSASISGIFKVYMIFLSYY